MARDCVAENAECRPLADAAGQTWVESVRRAEAFWLSWQGDPWPAIRRRRVEAVERVLGPEMGYYTIDGGKWPPRGLLRFERPEETILVTVGVCLRPQPAGDDPAAGNAVPRRIELAVAFDSGFHAETWEEISRFLSPLTASPWKNFTPLIDGQLVECGAIPVGPGGVRFAHALLWRDPPGAPPLGLPAFRNDPVDVLWLVPVTAAERRAEAAGGIEALKRRLAAGGVGWVHRDRQPVA